MSGSFVGVGVRNAVKQYKRRFLTADTIVRVSAKRKGAKKDENYSYGKKQSHLQVAVSLLMYSVFQLPLNSKSWHPPQLVQLNWLWIN